MYDGETSDWVSVVETKPNMRESRQVVDEPQLISASCSSLEIFPQTLATHCSSFSVPFSHLRRVASARATQQLNSLSCVSELCQEKRFSSCPGGEETRILNRCWQNIWTKKLGRRGKAFWRHCSQVSICICNNHCYELVFSIYKVPRGDFWEKQLDQDDDGSEAEADEGLQEAPGSQIHL